MDADWKTTFHKGLAPSLSLEALVALKGALERDDKELIQGSTTCPPPLQTCLEWPVEGACAICYGCWKGDGLETVDEVGDAFARVCFEIDRRLGEAAGCRHWLNWFDETPRNEMRALLLPEVELAILEKLSHKVDNLA